MLRVIHGLLNPTVSGAAETAEIKELAHLRKARSKRNARSHVDSSGHMQYLQLDSYEDTRIKVSYGLQFMEAHQPPIPLAVESRTLDVGRNGETQPPLFPEWFPYLRTKHCGNVFRR